MSMDFIVALPSIIVVFNEFTKIPDFVHCHNSDDGSYINHFHVKEIIKLYGIVKIIVSD